MVLSKTNLKHILFWIFLLFPFIPINYLTSTYSICGTIYTFLRCLVVFVLVFRLIVHHRRLSFPLIHACIFIGVAFISSYIGKVDLHRVFSYAILFIGFILIIEDGIRTDIVNLIRAMSIFFRILIVANFIFICLFPNGFSIEYGVQYYMFGNYNTTIRKVMPGLIASLIYSFYKKGKISVWFYIIYGLMLAFSLYVGSATTIVGLFIFLIPILLYLYTGKQGIFKYHYFFCGSIVITVVFAILQNFSTFRFLEVFITQILKKDMTLSSRTTVWANALSLIKENWFWGYGQVDTDINRQLLGAATAHNVFLDMLYYSGIVGLILLVVLVIVVGKKLSRARRNCNITVVIFDAVFCSYFLMWNFEPFADLNSIYVIYGMFIMAYYCDKFIDLGIENVSAFAIKFK